MQDRPCKTGVVAPCSACCQHRATLSQAWRHPTAQCTVARTMHDSSPPVDAAATTAGDAADVPALDLDAVAQHISQGLDRVGRGLHRGVLQPAGTRPALGGRGGRRSRTPSLPRPWKLVTEAGCALEPAEQPIARAVATGRTASERILGGQHPNGQRTCLQLTARPRTDTSGKVTGVVVTVSPTPSRPRGFPPAALCAAVIEAMSEGVVLHDATGAIISANASAERIPRPQPRADDRPRSAPTPGGD